MNSNLRYRKACRALLGIVPAQLFIAVATALPVLAQPVIQPVAQQGQCNQSGAAGVATIGGVICNFIANTQDSQAIFPALCYLFGIFIGVWAIAKLYEHVQNPHQVSVWEPIKRAVVAGALFALPIVIEAAYNTLTNGNNEGLITNTWSGSPTGGGLDAMVAALMNDSFKPMANLIMMFCYFAGVVLIIIGITRLMKSAQEGPRGPGGFGTIMTFIIGGVLLSADEMMGAAEATFFGDNMVFNQAHLMFNAGLQGTEEEHVMSVISAALAFVMILGWISFVRGWFIVRDVAEGNQQASMMAAMTHILGGALAINLGAVLNAVQTTFGLEQIGINFF